MVDETVVCWVLHIFALADVETASSSSSGTRLRRPSDTRRGAPPFGPFGFLRVFFSEGFFVGGDRFWGESGGMTGSMVKFWV